LVSVNSPAFVPLKVTELTVKVTAPEFVSVTGVGLLLLPTVCEGNANDAGERLVPGVETVELISTKTVSNGLSMIKSGFPSPFISAACSSGAV
jgi:hypothetical protein